MFVKSEKIFFMCCERKITSTEQNINTACTKVLLYKNMKAVGVVETAEESSF